MTYTRLDGMTEEELKQHRRAIQLKAYRKRQDAAGKPPKKLHATDEDRKAALNAAQKRWFNRKKQDQQWLDKWKADRLLRYRERTGPPKPRLTEEERTARQQAYRESYVRPEPTSAQKAKWTANQKARWAKYYANETPEQRDDRLVAKEFYRSTEVQPKVREIVEHIQYDFNKATSEEARQGVADEWSDVGLSCWLTAKALRYGKVTAIMGRYGYDA